jgi:hypothetical protein
MEQLRLGNQSPFYKYIILYSLETLSVAEIFHCNSNQIFLHSFNGHFHATAFYTEDSKVNKLDGRAISL